MADSKGCDWKKVGGWSEAGARSLPGSFSSEQETDPWDRGGALHLSKDLNSACVQSSSSSSSSAWPLRLCSGPTTLTTMQSWTNH